MLAYIAPENTINQVWIGAQAVNPAPIASEIFANGVAAEIRTCVLAVNAATIRRSIFANRIFNDGCIGVPTVGDSPARCSVIPLNCIIANQVIKADVRAAVNPPSITAGRITGN